MRILVTRPQPEAERTAVQLRDFGHEVFIEPLLDFEVVTPAPAELDFAGLGAMALTSERAVNALVALGVVDQLTLLPVFAVGDRSAEAAVQAGFKEVYSADGALGDLERLIVRHGVSGTLFYPHGRDLSGDLPKILENYEIKCRGALVYTMNARRRLSEETAQRLRGGEFDAVLFYSQRTAHTFTELLRLEKIKVLVNSMKALCVSEKIAAALDGFAEVEIAREPTEAALFDLILRKHAPS